MVSTGSVESTRAAVRILEQGGNAVDAAISHDARTGEFTGIADPGRAGFSVGSRVTAESEQSLWTPQP